MADFVIQRVVMPPEPRLTPLYYQASNPDPARRPDPRPLDRRTLALEPGTAVRFHSYFNSFFEPPWRRYTELRGLHLRLHLSGRGTIRLWRRSATTGTSVLSTVEVAGEEQVVRIDVPAPAHACEQGAVYFELLARRGPLTLHAGEWIAEGGPARPVGLVAGYCTHNRAPWLLANLRALLSDGEVAERLLRLVVVDQGSERVREHPEFASLPDGPGKLHLVEQGNSGASGGFTRAVLEGQGIQGASHVLLMDDDAVTEPESVLRAASFLALAREEIAVGGQMLDALRPGRLTEFTARLAPEILGLRRVICNLDVAEADRGLNPLLKIQPTHYNAWWFFAFPLSAVERVGLPLPFFLHFTDAEFGVRLARAGVQTIPVPGIGVWHAPFYLRARGWVYFYDVRNGLVTFALHQDISAGAMFRRVIVLLLHRLLSLNYFDAWAVCEAMRQYRRGPAALTADPRQTHQRILAARREFPVETLPRARLLHIETNRAPARRPRWFLPKLLRILVGQLCRRSPPARCLPNEVLRPKQERWWILGHKDVVAIDDPYSEDFVVLRRSRGQFVRLLLRGCWEAVRLWWSHRRVVRLWRDGFARLTSREQWLRYLGQTSGSTSPEEPAIPDLECLPRRAA